jgi:histidinol dehydrogenase
MNVLRYRDAGFAGRLDELTGARPLFDAEIEQRTRAIIEAVRDRGDTALGEFTRQFDGAELAAEQFAVSRAELFQASVGADDGLRAAVVLAGRNVEAFSRRSLRRGWVSRNAQGGRVGEKFDPLDRVGIYIPGGTAPLVSTAVMTVTLARVAGCSEIVVCTPPGRTGEVNPALLFAARASGATEIYKAGGAQAIAAMALGTTTIRPVRKIFGPGNAYVVAAKRLLYGHVAVDLLPGPSEVLVLADDSASAAFVAADLLAQAEHGSGHERVWLVTPSVRLLNAVKREITRQMVKLSRRDFIQKAMEKNGWLILVKTLEDGVSLVNRLAPEHCEVMTRNSEKVSKGILTAGAIFLGNYSPTVLGDYVAGPSHELPTGGAGHSFAGLTVDQFQRRTSVVAYDVKSLRRSLAALARFAGVEGLDAHGRSAEIRIRRR